MLIFFVFFLFNELTRSQDQNTAINVGVTYLVKPEILHFPVKI